MSPSLGRILVVDDEAPVREVLSEYFSSQGYTVDEASNGNDAIGTIRRHRPDVVLLDIRMPGLDGVEVLRRVRTFDDALTIIMVTANEDVAKPFDYDYLDRTVSAGMLKSGAGSTDVDPWRRLAHAVFRAARAMNATARASTGARLEAAALAAAREVATRRAAVAAEHLDEIELLLSIATDLGDLPGPDRTLVETALEAARRALPVAS